MRVLVADDYQPWQDFICTTIGTAQGVQVVGRVSDGLEAVEKARELQPDLILPEIGLRTVNGIEAALPCKYSGKSRRRYDNRLSLV